MAITWYRAFLHRLGGGGFDVVFPDFPGCVSGGASATEALRHAAEALAFHVESLDGPPPEPSDILDPAPDWAAPADATALVRLDLPGGPE